MDEVEDELAADAGIIVEKRKPTNVLFLKVFSVTLFLWYSLHFYYIYYGGWSRLETISPTVHDALMDLAFNIKFGFSRICLACSFASVICMLLISYIHRFTGFVVRCIITLVLLSLALLTAVVWYAYWLKLFFIGVPIAATVITIVIAMIFFSIRKHIRFVIRLFEEGGKVVQSMDWIFMPSFVTFVIFIVILFLALYLVPCILSIGQVPEVDEMGNSRLNANNWMKFAILFNFLVVFWIFNFLMGCQHMIIAGATVTWYFTRDKTRITNAVTANYNNLLKYHLGSVAVGSLIITMIGLYKFVMLKPFRILISSVILIMCWPLKCIIIMVTKKAYIAMGQLHQFVAFMRRFFMFLNENIYTEIAIYGDGFITSGKRLYRVLADNPTTVLTINSVSGYIMVLGRGVIIGSGLFIGCFTMKNEDGFTKIGFPMCVILIVSLFIAHVFISAFEMIVNSIFICFCEDCVINDGAERPYYMSKEMMIFINDRPSKAVPILKKQFGYTD